MKKIFSYFLVIVILLGLVRAITEVEQSVEAKVTVNPFPGKLNVSPQYLSVYAPPLSFVEKALIFQQDGNINLNVSLYLEKDTINDWISFSAVEFTLKPLEKKEIKIFTNIPNITLGYYSTKIHAIAGNQDLIIPINITLTNKYKIGLDIAISPDRTKAGQNISVLTKLTKSKLRKQDPEVEGKITVNLEYNVLKQKQLITTLKTTMDVINYNEKNISILIPANATAGRYTVEATATHLDKTAKDKDSFSVITNLLSRFFNLFR